jgi:hypothetical protein
MTKLNLGHAMQEAMCCPTCSAQQAWSDQCRRCKCDLSLLREWYSAGETERRQSLRQLRAGRPSQALRHARRYARIAGAQKASRLLAVCHLLCHHWPNSYAAFGEAIRQQGLNRAQ